MEELNRVHLNGLRAVEAVGRLGNLRAAAGELGVTVGAVSQQVQKTEKQLGRPLFERLAQGLRPTPLGEAVLGRLTAGMGELAAGVALARGDRDTVLTISVAPVFAGKWLVWRLSGFNAAYPDVRVRINAEINLVDPGIGGVDACIRVGRGDWPSVKAVKLLDHRVFPICSPAVAASLKTPADLATVPIIRDGGAAFRWDVWLDGHGLDADMLGDGPVYSDASMCLDAAVAGQGVFLAWDTLANDQLGFGSVVAPFAGRVPTGLAYWFVTAQGAGVNRNVEVFRGWLEAALRVSVAIDNC